MFKGGEEITSEGDYQGQINPTLFGNSPGFIFLRARPLKSTDLTIAQIKGVERPTAGLDIADGRSSGSFGANKWGRISYSLEHGASNRIATDYVQYFRSGEIEMVNGSCFRILGNDPIHLDFVVNKIAVMVNVLQEWMTKTQITNWLVEAGLFGVERRQLTLQNFGTRGPLLHRQKVSIQKKVNEATVSLLVEEVRMALLAEAGFES